MICKICGRFSEKLFSNDTCGFKCSAISINRIKILNGSHNFSTDKTLYSECSVCKKSISNANFASHNKNCELHYCPQCNSMLFKKSAKFCNRTCSALFNNKNKIISDTTKEKISNGLLCYYQHNTHKNFTNEIVDTCKQCGELFTKQKNSKNRFPQGHSCSIECTRKMYSNSGKKSAALKLKRSSDEISLFSLCSIHFNKAENNKIIHDGWDADIVINDKNLIFWNGPWHYKNMKIKNVSLLQIQNRDEIKIDLFNNLGYNIFIYEDRYFSPVSAFEDLKLHIIN